MSDFDQLAGSPFQPVTDDKKVPGGLNVLTILTFIGCALGLIMTVYGQVTMKDNLEKMEKMQGSEELEKMPDFAKKMFSPEAVEQLRVSYENRIPILILTLLGIALCLYGAIQMRSLKKQGYYLWLIGELLPVIGTVIFVGVGVFTGFAGIIAIVITALFVILYSLQFKRLKY